MSFWKDGLSIDEGRISTLIILCFVAAIFGLVMYKINGDISNNLLEMIKTLIYIIGGVNITDKITSAMNKNK